MKEEKTITLTDLEIKPLVEGFINKLRDQDVKIVTIKSVSRDKKTFVFSVEDKRKPDTTPQASQ